MSTIRQIRNATLKIEYGGVTFLVDPWLAPKDTYEGFPGSHDAEQRNPVVDLPIGVEEVVDGVDAVVVTHTHPDHWDRHAIEAIPADTPIFTQHFGDRALVGQGQAVVVDSGGPRIETVDGKTFSDVRVLTGNPGFDGVKLHKAPGQHGSDEDVQAYYDLLQEVTGVVFTAPGEKTVYLAGDTVFNHYVEATIAAFQPDVIIVNAGAARFETPPSGPIIMTAADVAQVARTAPDATVVATHLGAVNHATIDRQDLRDHLERESLADRVLVPEDGETITI